MRATTRRGERLREQCAVVEDNTTEIGKYWSKRIEVHLRDFFSANCFLILVSKEGKMKK